MSLEDFKINDLINYIKNKINSIKSQKIIIKQLLL